MHFGLEGIVGLALYVSFIGASLLSVFWRPVTGIFYLLPLIPLQTIRYRMNEFPFGGSVVGIILLAVALGVMRKGGSILPKTPWTNFLLIYVSFTYLSLCLGSLFLPWSLPIPGDPRFGTWQEYMTLPALLLMVAAVRPTNKQIKAMVIIMCVATLALDRSFWSEVSGRDFSAYSEDLRSGGSMGYAGINGLGAFEAQIATFLIAIAGYERKFWPRLGYYALAVFSAICLLYSLSRGAYAAILVGLLFLGLVKQRKLLPLLAMFLLTWTSLVPTAVQERVMMSYDENTGGVDHSAATRLVLWEDAMQLFRSSPAVGTGFNTYAYMHREKRVDGGTGYYEDTHNIYLKVLVESGVLGLMVFFWLLVKTFFTGFRLFRIAKDPLFASLGLGLAGWVICAVVANAFGDRWSFFQVSGYMWVLCGLVSQGLLIEQASSTKDGIESHAAEDQDGAPAPGIA
jgi:O-antigen ligase